MKMAFLLIVLSLSGCNFNDEPRRYSHLPNQVGRFTDGDVTCWTFHQEGISCLKNALPENE